eukprot:TRINITY_DN1668_c1_g2_i1.p1 TRINITY_DN1668_c1_g2~~TRINITY_DN1668_c1_g2_i1.p1  ORF type:complete len:538 (+),score=107.99 TRINITY_DN1668_c1_g2_i1:1144-2757(+)
MTTYRKDVKSRTAGNTPLEEDKVAYVKRWLNEMSFVVIDGGTGTEIEKLAGTEAMNSEGWSCKCNLTHPEVVKKVHLNYLQAGADIIIANTYATNPNVMLAGGSFTPKEQRRSTIEGVRLAKEAVGVNSAGGGHMKPLVAGSLSCHPPLMPPNAEFDKGIWPPPDVEERNCTLHAQQLKDSGVDVIFLEMVWDLEHGKRALRAAVSVGLPVFAAVCIPLPMEGKHTMEALRRLTIPDDEITLGGSGSTSVVEAVQEMMRYPNVVGINVHHTPLPFVKTALEAVRRAGWKGFLGVYPDHGTFCNPHWVTHELDKSQFLLHCEEWVEKTGCKAIGGCCGVGPDVIQGIHGHKATLIEKYKKWENTCNPPLAPPLEPPPSPKKPTPVAGAPKWAFVVFLLVLFVWFDLQRGPSNWNKVKVTTEWSKDCGEEWRGVWFLLMDTDNDGTVTPNEFNMFMSRRPHLRRRILRNSNLTMDMLLMKLDPSNTGVVTLSNFAKLWRSPIVGQLEDPCPLPRRAQKKPVKKESPGGPPRRRAVRKPN